MQQSPSPTTQRFVTLSFDGGVGRITLARPERLNAISPQVAAQLLEALTEAVGQGARILVLRGEGRAFSSGHDLKEPDPPAGSKESDDHLDTLQHITRVLTSPNLVSVCALHGYALGAGAEIAIACDIVIADTSTKMSFPEVQAGLSMTGGGSYLLPRIVGFARAKRLVLLGETLDAKTAFDWGLVSHLVDPEQLDKEVESVIETFRTVSAQGLAIAKTATMAALGGTLDDALAREIDHAKNTLASDELRQARHSHWDDKR
jgi:enoyl-CoA hydratase/carnithine racemase